MTCLIEPAINVYAKDEYIKRIVEIRDVAKIIQFDVIDGIFARPGNFNNPEIVKNTISSAKVDLHFMVMNVEKEIERWVKINPARIIIHVEQPGNIQEYFRTLEIKNIKKGLAIAPFTPLEKITSLIGSVDYLLLMSVLPGRNGQKFMPETIEKLIILREKYPKLEIGIDGGINEQCLLDLKKAGANNIVIGSAIFDGVAKENYKRFCEIIR